MFGLVHKQDIVSIHGIDKFHHVFGPAARDAVIPFLDTIKARRERNIDVNGPVKEDTQVFKA